MPATEKLAEFFRRVAFYRYHDGFQVGERDYKIRLASAFAKSRELIASHPALHRGLTSRDNNIINWRTQETYNGLLLAPNLDAAFDRGLITFGDDGRIIISSSLHHDDREALGIRRNFTLRRVSPSHLQYLRYHREIVFRK